MLIQGLLCCSYSHPEPRRITQLCARAWEALHAAHEAVLASAEQDEGGGEEEQQQGPSQAGAGPDLASGGQSHRLMDHPKQGALELLLLSLVREHPVGVAR